MDYPKSVPSVGLVGGKFVDEDPLAGSPGSLIPSQWGNAVTDELLNVIAGAGLQPDEDDNAQLLSAIRLLNKQPVLLSDTGAVNAYSASNVPALTALPGSGYVQRVVIAHANTGPSTYAPDGQAPKPVFGLGLQPLQGGELPVGIAVLMYLVQAGVNGGNGAWIIIQSLGGAPQIPPALKSQHAMQLGQAVGRLIAVRTFISGGTYTPTVGTNAIVVDVCGGGGGGGSNSSTPSAGYASTGTGGSAGATARGFFSAAFSGLTITVGAGGAGGVSTALGSDGSNGGSSSLGALISAGGGVGGTAGAATNTFPTTSVEKATVAVGVGGTLYNGAGATGDRGLLFAANNLSSGKGASTAFGAGGYSKQLAAGGGQVAGANAVGFGAGGGAAASVTGGTNAAGGNGAPGFVVIWEYS